MQSFDSLTDFAEGLRQDFPASAAIFDGMRVEESGHRRRPTDLYSEKFGDHIPLIRRQDVRGVVTRRPVWLTKPLGLDVVRKQASAMEVETRRFYEKAAARAQDARVRKLLDDLAVKERSHEERAEELTEEKLQPSVGEGEDKANRRLFVLQIVRRSHGRIRLLAESAEVNRFTLEQNQAGGSRLPESDREDMEVFLARTRQLLPVLGSAFLAPIAQPTAKAQPCSSAASRERKREASAQRTASSYSVDQRPSWSSDDPRRAIPTF